MMLIDEKSRLHCEQEKKSFRQKKNLANKRPNSWNKLRLVLLLHFFFRSRFLFCLSIFFPNEIYLETIFFVLFLSQISTLFYLSLALINFILLQPVKFSRKIKFIEALILSISLAKTVATIRGYFICCGLLLIHYHLN